MKKKAFKISIIILFILLFVFNFHPLVKSKYDFLPTVHEFIQEDIDYIDSQGKAFKVAKQIWTEEYGYFSLLFMVFDYRLVDDRYWIIEGSNIFHRMFKVNSGGPYIIIEKNGCIHNINYTK